MMQSAPTPVAHPRRLRGAFVRFLLSGAVNTAATYVLYLLLIRLLPYRTSYTIAFIAGIALAYGLNRFFVFRSKGGLSTVTLFPAVYLLQYLLGLGIVSFWIETLGWYVELAPLAAITLTIPLTFLLSRRLFATR